MRAVSEWLGVRDKIDLLEDGLRVNPRNAGLLYELSASLAEAGENERSARAFQAACQIDSNPALISLVGPLEEISASQAVPIRDRAQSLVQHNVTISPVLAAWAIAEGLLGHDFNVKWLINYERFFVKTRSEIDDIGALAEEIRSDLSFYDRPAKRSIRKGWRRDNLNQSDSPATRALFRGLRACVDQYIQNLDLRENHPFPRSAPVEYELEAWAVVSDGKTYHESHIHHRAWLSGVYYVVRPAASLDRDMRRGWLHVGPPKWLGPLPGWDEKLVEPEPGTLVLMPAYFFHHTMPMGVDDERICVAFDVVPANPGADGTQDY